MAWLVGLLQYARERASGVRRMVGSRSLSGRHIKRVFMKNRDMLETAVAAARKGGLRLAELLPGRRDIRLKGARDVVTDADLEAEATVLEVIRRDFPDHAIVSEEGGSGGDGSRYTWLVDPLDGTRNYAHRLPFFAASVAALEAQEPIAGAVFDPLRDHMFSALRDGGARLNGGPLQVSSVEALGDALVGVDWGRRDRDRDTAFDMVGRLLPRCASLRAMGSAALALAYVAAGWLDAYIGLSVKPWDVAAGSLVVVEAGGECTTQSGNPYQPALGGCVASNGRVHRELLDLL
jgi:myo-inositol-1(or 4)-monophosphatase